MFSLCKQGSLISKPLEALADYWPLALLSRQATHTFIRKPKILVTDWIYIPLTKHSFNLSLMSFFSMNIHEYSLYKIPFALCKYPWWFLELLYIQTYHICIFLRLMRFHGTQIMYFHTVCEFTKTLCPFINTAAMNSCLLKN